MPAVALTIHEDVTLGTAANGGGTMVLDYALPTDKAVRIFAHVFLSVATGGPSHLTAVAGLKADCVVKNNNGVLTFATVVAASNNPASAANLAAASAEGSDAAFNGAGPPTVVFSISGTNVRLTITNPGGTSADVTVLRTIYTFSSL